MWDDGLGVMPRDDGVKGFKNVTLKSGDWLIYLGDEHPGTLNVSTYVRCMSKRGVVWVFPNLLSLVEACTGDPDEPSSFLDPNSA
jgi:hypothetical protein